MDIQIFISLSSKIVPSVRGLRVDSAASDASERAGSDELRHVAREPAEHTADSKNGVSKQDARFSAEYVAELHPRGRRKRSSHGEPKWRKPFHTGA